jgi:hypothetical protein
MIHLHLAVLNPWHNERRWPWQGFYQNSWRVSQNKTLEVCVDFYTLWLFQCNINTRASGADHAGPELCVVVLGLGFQISLPDSRHWDNETNTWATHE